MAAKQTHLDAILKTSVAQAAGLNITEKKVTSGCRFRFTEREYT